MRHRLRRDGSEEIAGLGVSRHSAFAEVVAKVLAVFLGLLSAGTLIAVYRLVARLEG